MPTSKPELTSSILDLKRQGLSHLLIAEQLGISRNQVAGVVFRAQRNGQSFCAKPVRRKSSEKSEAPQGPAVRAKPVVIPATPDIEPRPVSPPQCPVAVVSEPISCGAPAAVSSLRSAQCRWPIGDPYASDFRFCCAPIGAAAQPYCAEHRSLANARACDRRAAA